MKKISSFIFLYSIALLSFGQIDSTKIYVESKIGLASKGYLTQWQGYNQYGLLDPNNNDGYLRGGVEVPLLRKNKLSITTGLDIVLKPHDINESFINLAYGTIKYGSFSLKGGRYALDENTFNHELSSGNLFHSINTRPYWKVGGGLYDWTNVPFTNGFLQIRGFIEVGYLENERPVREAKYHEKSAFIKTNKLPVNIIFGLSHSVLFDGIRPNSGDDLPGNFFEAFFAQNALSSGNRSDSVNAAGAHFGVFNIGFEIPGDEVPINIYYDQPISDGSGIDKWFSRNKDFVIGIEAKFKKHPFLKSVVYEHINTIHQSGPGLADPFINGRFLFGSQLLQVDFDQFLEEEFGVIRSGTTEEEFFDIIRREANNGYEYGGRDDYFNNGNYQRGNTYFGQQFGNPLFTTQERLLRTNNDDGNVNRFFVNNRIIAHHIGVKGEIGEYGFKFLTTLTNNYGTYSGFYGGSRESLVEDLDYSFREILNQVSMLYEISKTVNSKFSYNLALGFDFGDFGNNIGLSGGLRYNIK